MEDRKTIAICLPGEHFSSVWVANLLCLFAEIFNRFHVSPMFGYSSNVYATRNRMTEGVIEADENFRPVDYVLWIDDDNTLTWPQFEMLLADLEEDPELDAVAGWCWVQSDGYAMSAIPSCGMFDGNRTIPLDLARLVEVNGQPAVGPDVQPIEYTGFPVVLMKFATLAKAGPLPFSPIIDFTLRSGFMGEDTSFWKRAQGAGVKLAVDRRVKVPHYKLRAAEPVSAPAANAVLVEV